MRVERPSNNADRLASLVKARMGPIAVVGPVGSGKSTELAAASSALTSHFLTALIPFDRLMDMRQLDDGSMFLHIGHQLAQSATHLNQHLGWNSSAFNFRTPPDSMANPHARPSRNDLLSWLREIRRASTQQSVALLLDGLEKCPGDVARQAIRTLLTLREEAELVIVTPLELVTGPEGYEFLTELRPFHIRPVPVFRKIGTGWDKGRSFLKEIFCLRMGLQTLEPSQEQLLEFAAVASSGLPRTFLQLLRSAGGYATIAGREFFVAEDLQAAILDQKESLLRILRDGDMHVLDSVNGEEGLEIPLERRIRLLTHGLLLEYEESGRVLVRMNNLPQYSGTLTS
ncbi:type IV pilus twitching motility protein PilT [Hyalangium versicolor]|uniref:type IV pilus twitching motility protein PilT n=1 Tax=Hyalangium versicolor TaxID=2861190 RepID=UPI001CCC9DCF|nr:type IV pilus twitching motility protein PilT [Hyalangium versicolor]